MIDTREFADASDFVLKFICQRDPKPITLKAIKTALDSNEEVSCKDVNAILLYLQKLGYIVDPKIEWEAYQVTADGKLFVSTNSFRNELDKKINAYWKQKLERSREIGYQREMLEEQKRSNAIAQEANTRSKSANQISIAAVIISIIAVIASVLVAIYKD